jgi:hypothetical protein
MSNTDFDVMKDLTAEDKKKIKHAIDLGLTVSREIADLRTGLSETVKEVAAELRIKPGVLNKAIRIAFKSSIAKSRAEQETLEEILDAAGRGEA